jgi:hypothetical protein
MLCQFEKDENAQDPKPPIAHVPVHLESSLYSLPLEGYKCPDCSTNIA